jgi:hypothetical protein
MGQVTTLAQFAARATRLSGIAAPDHVPPCLLDAVAISGSAPITATTQRPDGLVQLQIQREILLAQSRHALSLRQSKQASLIEADLHSVTHEILWFGMQPKGV